MGDLISDTVIVFAVIGLVATAYHGYRTYRWVRTWVENKFSVKL